MNLPEYRRVYRMATEAFQAAVGEASDRLAKELAIADEKFFEDREKAVEVDDNYVIEKRR